MTTDVLEVIVARLPAPTSISCNATQTNGVSGRTNNQPTPPRSHDEEAAAHHGPGLQPGHQTTNQGAQ
jgi:hypothetical protein